MDLKEGHGAIPEVVEFVAKNDLSPVSVEQHVKAEWVAVTATHQGPRATQNVLKRCSHCTFPSSRRDRGASWSIACTRVVQTSGAGAIAGTDRMVVSRPDFRGALSSFSSLTVERIYSDVGVDLDDTATLELARGCPLLKTLDLDVNSAFPGRPRATLQCLRYFARHFRMLVDVTLSLDGSTIPDDLDEEATPQTSLSYFDVQSSLISDSTRVARLLSVFPNLRTLKTLQDFDSQDADRKERE
ncbi:hypothetical protein FB45DRAFT_1066934 [Roridomyces roridus]|uniref:Uncharacterized protein n=1 Tax=Roridomyces roridus TaxID=1738132 RepID=A0AAD7B444_9AGAR|nr:hypothetical protein FB45DRAFT_1066934 [Roridomyces roridus]